MVHVLGEYDADTIPQELVDTILKQLTHWKVKPMKGRGRNGMRGGTGDPIACCCSSPPIHDRIMIRKSPSRISWILNQVLNPHWHCEYYHDVNQHWSDLSIH